MIIDEKNRIITRVLRNIGYVYRTLRMKAHYGKRITIGYSAKVSKNVEFYCKGKMIFDDKCLIKEGTFITIGDVEGQLIIGDSVFINRNATIGCRNRIEIGKNTIIGPNVTIYDHDHLIDNNTIQGNQFSSESIVIGKNCWIGSGVIILKGTIIGDNSIVAAGSIVKDIIPDNSVFYNSITKKTQTRGE